MPFEKITEGRLNQWKECKKRNMWKISIFFTPHSLFVMNKQQSTTHTEEKQKWISLQNLSYKLDLGVFAELNFLHYAAKLSYNRSNIQIPFLIIRIWELEGIRCGKHSRFCHAFSLRNTQRQNEQQPQKHLWHFKLDTLEFAISIQLPQAVWSPNSSVKVSAFSLDEWKLPKILPMEFQCSILNGKGIFYLLCYFLCLFLQKTHVGKISSNLR